jgi:YidC/Oxa1 family membrane protein insertase
MVKMQPMLEDIKQRFAGNSTLILEEQKKLYKQEHYSMLKGMLPLLLQIPIILGLINVIYNPLQHILHIDPQIIRSLVAQAANYLNLPVAELGYSAQLKVMELVQADAQIFADVPKASEAIAQILSVNTSFLGVNMALNPDLLELSLVYPLLSGVSALVLCLFQNKFNVLQLNQGFWGKWGTGIFLIAFSAYFAVVLPCGVGLYWIVGNLLSIVVLALCNLIFDPKKYIDFSKLPKKPQLTREQRADERVLKKQQAKKEKADAKRFSQQLNKQLVFYSEASGFYKYYERLIVYLLANSEVIIHYVTSDFNDQVFELAKKPGFEALRVYYIGPNALISFMMKMDADIVVMSMPDLETFHIKRSLVRKDVEYIYLDHGMGSFHLVLREHALDNFDTIFCYGPNHIDEVRAAEELYELPPKNLVVTGFGLLDNLLQKVAADGYDKSAANKPPIALVAPSWQKDNLIELCLPQTVQPLLDAGFKVIVRPHPESVKRFASQIQAAQENFLDQIAAGSLEFQTDFASNFTVYSADIVVTDWSTIAQEFSFATKKPSIFINTPMKVMNSNWQKLDLVPLEIALRDKLGASLDLDELQDIGKIASTLVKKHASWQKRITKVMSETVYDIGCSEVSSAEYILDTLAVIAELRQKKTSQSMTSNAGTKNKEGSLFAEATISNTNGAKKSENVKDRSVHASEK